MEMGLGSKEYCYEGEVQPKKVATRKKLMMNKQTNKHAKKGFVGEDIDQRSEQL